MHTRSRGEDDAEVRGGVEVQVKLQRWCRAGAEVHIYGGEEVQRWRSFNVESLLRFSRQGDCAGAVYRGAEEQRSKGVEVQRLRGAGVEMEVLWC